MRIYADTDTFIAVSRPVDADQSTTSGTDTYATTYGGICAAAGEAYRMDLDAANHDAAVWTAVCAVLALAGIAGLVVSVTRIEYGRH